MRLTRYREIWRVLRHPDAAGVLSDFDTDRLPMGDHVYYLRPGDFGLMIFVDMGQGVYQVHAAMVQEAQPVKPLIDAAFRWMADNTDMRRAFGPIKRSNRPARTMARLVGMSPVGATEDRIIYEWVKHGRNH